MHILVVFFSLWPSCSSNAHDLSKYQLWGPSGLVVGLFFRE